MAAKYPASLWAPSSITDGTDLEAVLFTDLAAEIDAIEAELGVNVHGLAGSLADRLRMAFDESGEVSYLRDHDAAVGERRRIRAGITIVDLSSDDVDHYARGSVATIAIDPPLSYVPRVLATIEFPDGGGGSVANYGCYKHGTATTSQFKVVLSKDGAGCATSGVVPVHWLAWEYAASTTDKDY